MCYNIDAGASLSSTSLHYTDGPSSKRRQVTHGDEDREVRSSRDLGRDVKRSRDSGRDVEGGNRDVREEGMGLDPFDPYEEEVRRAAFKGRRSWANLSG